MKFTTGSGMNRDPRYEGPRGLGALGLSNDIVNWPQRIAQWWLVAFLLAFFALPWGVWGALFDQSRSGGVVFVSVYFVIAALFGLCGWILRNEIGEDYPQLTISILASLAGLAAFIWLCIFRTFSDGQWFAGIVCVVICLVAVNILFRSWQLMLVIGLFTEQKRQLIPPPEYAEQVAQYRNRRTKT